MITDLHHTTLFVTDLDRSLGFYVDTLGFELVNENRDRAGPFLDEVCAVDDVRINLALIRAGGEIIELIEVLSPASLPSDANEQRFGIARVGFEVDDIESTVAELRTKGVEFMSEIVSVIAEPGQHYAGGKAIFFQDPDGIILELQQPPEPGRVT